MELAVEVQAVVRLDDETREACFRDLELRGRSQDVEALYSRLLCRGYCAFGEDDPQDRPTDSLPGCYTLKEGMRTVKTVKPGHKGTKEFLSRYGANLLRVRYRYHEDRGAGRQAAPSEARGSTAEGRPV